MKLDIYQIDAFAAGPFEGNPAAVMPLTDWLDDSVLQQLAEENNLSETAFYTAGLPADAGPHDPEHPAYHLRWFTPAVEVDLCGHATLATAAQIFEDVHPDADRIQFRAAGADRGRSPDRRGTRHSGAGVPEGNRPRVRRRIRTRHRVDGTRLRRFQPAEGARNRRHRGIRRRGTRLRVAMVRRRGRRAGGSGDGVRALADRTVLG
nr:phenazine biosynthesis-like family protein [Rhodococcus sp. JVH1]